MRQVYFFMSVSLDGYFEGPDHDLSWHNVDDEFNEFAVEQLRQTDLYLFGRRVYETMEAFWPNAPNDPSLSKDDLEIARQLNHTPKIVYSKTLDRVVETENWTNVTLLRDFDPEEVRRLKQQPGKSIGAGGSDFALSLIKHGLIDEFRLMITPVCLGRGTPLFSGLDRRRSLELIGARRFKSGSTLLTYKPA